MKGRVFVTADSHRGRQLTQAKGARIANDTAIPRDVREHNQRIEAKRQADLASRKSRRKP